MRHQILVRAFVLVVAIVFAGSQGAAEGQGRDRGSEGQDRGSRQGAAAGLVVPIDRKSTRLNSSHSQISYAVFCLKKKKRKKRTITKRRNNKFDKLIIYLR